MANKTLSALYIDNPRTSFSANDLFEVEVSGGSSGATKFSDLATQVFSFNLNTITAGPSYSYFELQTTASNFEAAAGFRAKNNSIAEVLFDVYTTGASSSYLGQSLANMGRFVANSSISSFVINTEGTAPIIFGVNSVECLRVSNGGFIKVQQLNIAAIPTSSSGLVSGDVWNNLGILNIV